MCDVQCLDFVRGSLAAADIAGKHVLEVGSLDVNGSARAILQPLGPSSYVGVDIAPGPGVDVICNSENLVEKFGPESFDVVVSTEMLEHVQNWRLVISNLKKVLKPNGTLVITTRRIGFPFHGYPHDFWRFERSDFQQVFSDMEIRRLECDDASLGIFLVARRPEAFNENNLSSHELFSILSGKRTRGLENWEVKFFNASRRVGDAVYPYIGRYRDLLPPLLRKSARKIFVRHYGE
ncbi:MAG: methyltransferase domain-containing protein [Pseudomonadota bacterium]